MNDESFFTDFIETSSVILNMKLVIHFNITIKCMLKMPMLKGLEVENKIVLVKNIKVTITI